MLKRIGAEESGEFKAIASGTLPSGKPVVVNADGTVSAAASTGTAGASGTKVIFDGSPVEGMNAVYDSSNNKVVVIYSDNGNSKYGTAIVGTVNNSNNSISFGTPVVFNSSTSEKVGATFDSNSNKVIALWHQLVGTTGRAAVGTVSGTSISFGSAADFTQNTVGDEVKGAFDSNLNKVAVVYRDQDSSDIGKCAIGTVSGTSISFGSEVTFRNAAAYNPDVCFDSNENCILVFYQTTGDDGYISIGDISGTSVTFTTEISIGNDAERTNCEFDPISNKVVLAYTDRPDGESAAAKTVTIGGSSGSRTASFGSEVNFATGVSQNCVIKGIAYDPDSNRMLISYLEESGGNLKLASGTISGTDISFGTPQTVINEMTSARLAPVVYDTSQNRAVVIYEDRSSSSESAAIVVTVDTLGTNLTSENYIGMSKGGAVADTKGATVDIIGAIADIPVINYVLSNASYDSVRFNSSSQDGRMSGIAFNTDGTKMYLVGTDNDSVYQYSLSTPFNVSTASYDSVTLNVSSQSVFPTAIEFNNDGTKMFIGSSNTNGVFQYSLSSGFDLSTASYDSVSFNPSSQESNVQGIQFNNDGTKMYIIGTANNTVFQYSLSTGFNLSTASYDSVSFSVASQNTTAQGLEFNNDGTKLFVIDNEPTEEVYQYDLTTGFDISTASYSNIKLDVSSEDSTTFGISFNADGSKMYLAGQDTDYIYQYSTAGSSLTAGQKYYVQTDGTISTTAGSPSVLAGTAISATELLVKT